MEFNKLNINKILNIIMFPTNANHGFFLSLGVVDNNQRTHSVGPNTLSHSIPEEIKEKLSEQVHLYCLDFFNSRHQNEMNDFPPQEREKLEATFRGKYPTFYKDLASQAKNFFDKKYLYTKNNIPLSEARNQLLNFMLAQEAKKNKTLASQSTPKAKNCSTRNHDAIIRLRNRHLLQQHKDEMKNFSQTPLCFCDFNDAREYLCFLLRNGTEDFSKQIRFAENNGELFVGMPYLKSYAATSEQDLLKQHEKEQAKRLADETYRELMKEAESLKKPSSKKTVLPQKGPKKKQEKAKANITPAILPPEKKSAPAPISLKIFGGEQNPYHYHPRILRWAGPLDSIRDFVDFDQTGTPVQHYKEASTEQLKWAKCRHNIPGVEQILLNSNLDRFQYTVPTDRGAAFLAKLKRNQETEVHQGMVYLGIDKETKTIYHMMFHELSFSTLSKSMLSLLIDPDLTPFQESNTPDSISGEEKEPWQSVGKYSLEGDEKGVISFHYPDKTLFIYPLN